jgi:hypothetical protein
VNEMMGRRGEATAPPRTRRERPLRPRILPALGQARCACQRMRTTTQKMRSRAFFFLVSFQARIISFACVRGFARHNLQGKCEEIHRGRSRDKVDVIKRTPAADPHSYLLPTQPHCRLRCCGLRLLRWIGRGLRPRAREKGSERMEQKTGGRRKVMRRK